MRNVLLIVVSLGAVACGGDPFTCAIGSLTGTWRTHYVQTDGTCGAIPDETTILGGSGSGGATYTQQQISADHCREDAHARQQDSKGAMCTHCGGQRGQHRSSHRGLPDDAVSDHTGGWDHFLGRLAIVATGGDAGPDLSPGGN